MVPTGLNWLDQGCQTQLLEGHRRSHRDFSFYTQAKSQMAHLLCTCGLVDLQ